MKNAIIIAINILFLGAIAFFAFKGQADITGFAVAENPGVVVSYLAAANMTEIGTGEASGFYLPERDVYFAKQAIQDYDETRLKLINTETLHSNGTMCSEGDYLQSRYYYDADNDGLQGTEEPYILLVKTDQDGCVVAELPEEGYKAMLAL